jgi:hypothetical protein
MEDDQRLVAGDRLHRRVALTLAVYVRYSELGRQIEKGLRFSERAMAYSGAARRDLPPDG